MRQFLHYVVGGALVFSAYYLSLFIVHVTALPIPAPLLGLLLLLGVLFAAPSFERHVAKFALFPLKHMSLLFVPAVLGVSLYWADIVENALGLFIAIVLTTAVSLGTTAWFSQRLFIKKGDSSPYD
ncbi:hypothetical protein KUC3_08450 [Alteromonas sp. KC3]|uniref:CidA/LrgA family protein n=1 Tax=unclassified Alteromonas TaxID=2614992 RepID=UPI001924C8E4|nr:MULTISPECIES: CidA/LrgA family protein [unclassified Alteromonas]BCO17988.1 hypothetical protein KUC3_08450 [Alteromonas sp. KC3]BCO21949.1 hypothetical protein KUC14_08180 [Alteromonas sp. KC14]